jgi:hypothetical protein
MGVQLLFQFDQLMRQLLMSGQVFTESDKYPDDINADVGFPHRPIPKPEYAAAWKKRTLTNLYNEMPAGLKLRQEKQDRAVAAYEWPDYTPDISDEVIPHRLPALSLERGALTDP